MLFHEKSNMFPGSKSTRWSGPYIFTRTMKNDVMELWHKSSGKFKVSKRRLKIEKNPDPPGQSGPNK